jgi:hypothetical protein
MHAVFSTCSDFFASSPAILSMVVHVSNAADKLFSVGSLELGASESSGSVAIKASQIFLGHRAAFYAALASGIRSLAHCPVTEFCLLSWSMLAAEKSRMSRFFVTFAQSPSFVCNCTAHETTSQPTASVGKPV